MDSLDKHLDKHVAEIAFRQCVTFCQHPQLKGWQPHLQPTIALWLCGFVTWKHGADFCKITKFGDHKTKPSSEDTKFWVQKIYGEESFESITDSQIIALTDSLITS